MLRFRTLCEWQCGSGGPLTGLVSVSSSLVPVVAQKGHPSWHDIWLTFIAKLSTASCSWLLITGARNCSFYSTNSTPQNKLWDGSALLKFLSGTDVPQNDVNIITEFSRLPGYFYTRPKHASFTCPPQMANDAYTQCLCAIFSPLLSPNWPLFRSFRCVISHSTCLHCKQRNSSSCEWMQPNLRTFAQREIVNHLARSKIATLPDMHVNEWTAGVTRIELSNWNSKM